MARALNQTQTASGASSVTVSKKIAPEIADLVRAEYEHSCPMPGEFTAQEIAVMLNIEDISANRLDAVLERLVSNKALEVRTIGRVRYFKVK